MRKEIRYHYLERLRRRGSVQRVCLHTASLFFTERQTVAVETCGLLPSVPFFITCLPVPISFPSYPQIFWAIISIPFFFFQWRRFKWYRRMEWLLARSRSSSEWRWLQWCVTPLDRGLLRSTFPFLLLVYPVYVKGMMMVLDPRLFPNTLKAETTCTSSRQEMSMVWRFDAPSKSNKPKYSWIY